MNIRALLPFLVVATMAWCPGGFSRAAEPAPSDQAAAAAALPAPAPLPVTATIAVHEAELEIDAGQTWARRLTLPEWGPDERLVLCLRARIDSSAKAGGGCNHALQVLVEGAPLVESLVKPRLLNKAPWFDPPGTPHHFPWFAAAHQAWTTIFCRSFEGNWAGSGSDYDFVFDLSGLAASGETLSLGLRHALPGLPAAMKRDRAPLVLDRVRMGLMQSADVEKLRREASKGLEFRSMPVETALPPDARPGDRAYEIGWSGRRESPPAQVGFDDLAGWRLQALGDANMALTPAVDHLIWRRQTAKLTYGHGTRDTVALLSPPGPVAIAGEFDAANLWLYGAVDRVKDRRLRFLALMEDAEGREFQIDLGPLTSCYWNLLHGVLDPKAASRLRWPAKFTALAIENLRVPDATRCVYLESLAFYRRNRQPFAKLERPAPPVFPTSADGMLPDPPAGNSVSAKAESSGAEWVSTSPGGTLRVRVRPEEGCLHGVTAQWNGGRLLRPLDGGGVKLDRGEGEILPEGAALVSSRLNGDRYSAKWSQGGVEWEADYAVRGRTLVVDVRCGGGAASGLAFGHVTGLPDPRGIEVPYLVMGRKPGPWIGCGGGLFVSVLPDFYHSDFSSVDAGISPPAGDRIGLVRGTVYTPLTDRRRNPLRERVLVTVSPDFAGTLPNVRNPVSPNRERLAPYLFFMGAASSQNLYRTLHRYGVDQVIASDFAKVLVNDYAEGFGMRWQPHPDLAIQTVQDWRKGIKSLGYLFGFYIDATDFLPGNQWFDENKVSLTPEGDFRDAWYGNFATKANAMPHLVRWTGEKVKQHYPADCVYLDVHTNRGLEAIDYEAGVEGAGIARALVLGNGDSILEARKWYGSTVSEGICRWLYAGVCDIDYATLVTSGNAAELPPLVDFDLLKIHPLEHGTMMGYGISAFFGQNTRTGLHGDGGKGAAPADFYRYVSSSLAYGHMLLLGYGYVPPLSRFIHYYALMQGVQREYLTDTAAGISYHNGKELVPTSVALAGDTQKLGRVCVRYARGLIAYVNLNPDQPWLVESNGSRYELPPWGWLLVKPGEILAYSALRNGARVDFVQCPGYLYLHAGNGRASEGPLEAEGAVWLKRQGKGWRLIPCGYLGQWKTVPVPGATKFCVDYELPAVPADRGSKRILLDTRSLMGKPASGVVVKARDAAGTAVPAAIPARPDGRLEINPEAPVVDYALE